MKLTWPVALAGTFIGVGAIGVFVSTQYPIDSESSRESYMTECRVFADTDPILRLSAEGLDSVEVACGAAWDLYTAGVCVDRRTRFDLCDPLNGAVFYVDPVTLEVSSYE